MLKKTNPFTAFQTVLLCLGWLFISLTMISYAHSDSRCGESMKWNGMACVCDWTKHYVECAPGVCCSPEQECKDTPMGKQCIGEYCEGRSIDPKTEGCCNNKIYDLDKDRCCYGHILPTRPSGALGERFERADASDKGSYTCCLTKCAMDQCYECDGEGYCNFPCDPDSCPTCSGGCTIKSGRVGEVCMDACGAACL